MTHTITSIFNLFKKTFAEFIKDNAPQMAAALSYYALFAIPPILLITLSLLSIFLVDTQAQEALLSTVRQALGDNATLAVEQVLVNLNKFSWQSTFAQWLGIILLLITATGVVGHIQRSLNTLWEVSPKPTQPILFLIYQRILSLIFIALMGFLLLTVFIANTILSFLGFYISELLGISSFILRLGDIAISYIAVTILIGLIYKYLPDGKMSWKDIFIGAFVTALLFALGKYLIGIYVNQTTIASAYGAAGSILLLLLWIYYSSLIFFFGAEFTQVYANTYGKGISHIRSDKQSHDKKE